jgi:hypothetical protein
VSIIANATTRLRRAARTHEMPLNAIGMNPLTFIGMMGRFTLKGIIAR